MRVSLHGAGCQQSRERVGKHGPPRRQCKLHVWSLPGLLVVFDTHRAAGSFVHVSGLSMRCNFAAGRNGVLGFMSESGPRTRVGPLLSHGFPEADHAIGCSISRPRTPRYPPRAGRARRIPLQAARPAWTTSFPWFRSSFCMRRPRERRRLIRLRAMGARVAHTTPSGLQRIPLETSPDVRDHPVREGSNHSIGPKWDTTLGLSENSNPRVKIENESGKSSEFLSHISSILALLRYSRPAKIQADEFSDSPNW